MRNEAAHRDDSAIPAPIDVNCEHSPRGPEGLCSATKHLHRFFPARRVPGPPPRLTRARALRAPNSLRQPGGALTGDLDLDDHVGPSHLLPESRCIDAVGRHEPI